MCVCVGELFRTLYCTVGVTKKQIRGWGYAERRKLDPQWLQSLGQSDVWSPTYCTQRFSLYSFTYIEVDRNPLVCTGGNNVMVKELGGGKGRSCPPVARGPARWEGCLQ